MQLELDQHVTGRTHESSARPSGPGPTSVPRTLQILDCRRTFDTPRTSVSDRYGLVTDLAPPPIQQTDPRVGRNPRVCGSGHDHAG